MTPDELKKRFPALQKADDPALEALLGAVRELGVGAGQTLISPGVENDCMYLICAGRVRVSLGCRDESITLGEFGPGQWIGEMGMIQPAPPVATVEVVQDSALLALCNESFMALRHASPKLTSVLLQMLCTDMSARLHATVTFMDRETGDEQPDAALPRGTLIAAAKNLLGIAARTGA